MGPLRLWSSACDVALRHAHALLTHVRRYAGSSVAVCARKQAALHGRCLSLHGLSTVAHQGSVAKLCRPTVTQPSEGLVNTSTETHNRKSGQRLSPSMHLYAQCGSGCSGCTPLHAWCCNGRRFAWSSTAAAAAVTATPIMKHIHQAAGSHPLRVAPAADQAPAQALHIAAAAACFAAAPRFLRLSWPCCSKAISAVL